LTITTYESGLPNRKSMKGDCTNEQDATLIADKSMPEGVVPDIMKKLKEELRKAETKHRQKPERTV
jgi:hypothetical protein